MSCFVGGVEVVVEVLRFSVGVDLCGENFWLFWHRWGRIDIDFDGMDFEVRVGVDLGRINFEASDTVPFG